MTPPTLLAQLPDNPSLSELLQFQFTGLVVVFGALAALWVMLEILGKVFQRRNAAHAPSAAPPTAQSPASAAADAAIPPEILAAIAAAVHVTLRGRPHRVLSIKSNPGSTNWAAEGRREIFSSHRVR